MGLPGVGLFSQERSASGNMIKIKFDGEEKVLYSHFERQGQIDYRYVVIGDKEHASKEVSSSWLENHMKRCLRQRVTSSLRVVEKVADTELCGDGIYRPKRLA